MLICKRFDLDPRLCSVLGYVGLPALALALFSLPCPFPWRIHVCIAAQGMASHDKRFKTLTYELHDSTPDLTQDILTDAGFVVLLKYVLRLRRTGMALLAPVCSSWRWLNRFTSGRSRDNWQGNTSVLSVRQGNLMVSRVVLLLWLLDAMGCVYVLEQPLGSILDAHARFQEFLKTHVVWRVLHIKEYV